MIGALFQHRKNVILYCYIVIILLYCYYIVICFIILYDIATGVLFRLTRVLFKLINVSF